MSGTPLADGDRATKKPRFEPADTPPAGGTPAQGFTFTAAPAPNLGGLATPAFGGAVAGGGPAGGWAAATPMFSAAGGMTGGGGAGSGWGAATPMMMGTGASTGGSGALPGATPNFGFGATPALGGGGGMMGETPAAGSGIMGETPSGWGTGVGTGGLEGGVATGGFDPAVSEAVKKILADTRTANTIREMQKRNRPMTDEDIDALIPAAGFDIVPEPEDYVPIRKKETNQLADDYEEPQIQVIGGGAAGGDGGTGGPRIVDIPDDLGHGLPKMAQEDVPVFQLLLQYHDTEDEDISKYHLNDVLILRALLKLKNGDTNQRRSGQKFLLTKLNILGGLLIFEHIFEIWNARILDMAQRHNYFKLIERLILTMKEKIDEPTLIKPLITMVASLLAEDEPKFKDQGRELTTSLAKAVGVNPIMKEMKQNMIDADRKVRILAAQIIALVARANGADKVLKFLQIACQAQIPHMRFSGVRAIGEIGTLLKFGVRKHLEKMIELLAPRIEDTDMNVSAETGQAICSLATAVAPFGFEQFAVITRSIGNQCIGHNSHGRKLAAYLKAMGNIIPLMDPSTAIDWSQTMLLAIRGKFLTQDEELKTAVLRLLKTCVGVDGISISSLNGDLLNEFFDNFWQKRTVVSKKSLQPLALATVALAKRIGVNEILEKLAPEMTDPDDDFQNLVLETVRRIVVTVGINKGGLLNQTERLLVENALSALDADETGTSRAITGTLGAIFNGLPKSGVDKYLSDLLVRLRARLDNKHDAMRKQSSELLTEIVPCLKDNMGEQTLRDVLEVLYEKLDVEPSADAMGAQVELMMKLLGALEKDSIEELRDPDRAPSLKDILRLMMRLIKNPNDWVQQKAVQVIGKLAEFAEAGVTWKESLSDLHNLATDGLFKLLESKNRGTKQITIRVFGEIASALTPYQILSRLLDNLKKDERSTRICTQVAIASVAEQCGVEVVVPMMTNEYLLAEGTEASILVQRAILKGLRFLFQHVGSQGKSCAYSILGLLERGMTERDPQTRRMGLEAARHLMLALAEYPANFEDLAIHCMNFALPNIIESCHEHDSKGLNTEQEKLITATVEVFEAARLLVSPGVMLNYLLQGMFHKAQRVREIYWKTYNNFYLALSDQIVTVQPEMFTWEMNNAKRAATSSSADGQDGGAAALLQPDEQLKKEGERELSRKYHRHELDYFL